MLRCSKVSSDVKPVLSKKPPKNLFSHSVTCTHFHRSGCCMPNHFKLHHLSSHSYVPVHAFHHVHRLMYLYSEVGSNYRNNKHILVADRSSLAYLHLLICSHLCHMYTSDDCTLDSSQLSRVQLCFSSYIAA